MRSIEYRAVKWYGGAKKKPKADKGYKVGGDCDLVTANLSRMKEFQASIIKQRIGHNGDRIYICDNVQRGRIMRVLRAVAVIVNGVAWICRRIWRGSGSVRSNHQTVSSASKTLVLPSIFDTSVSSLMMRNLQSYPTTVFNKIMRHFRA